MSLPEMDIFSMDLLYEHVYNRGPPLTCSHQIARASFEDNTGQKMDREHRNA